MTAKKKNMSKKLGRKRGFIEFAKKHKIICFVLVLVFLFFGFRFGSVYLEKRDLEAKRVQLEQIADDIAAKFPTAERKSEQYCKYSNQKFSKGELSCTIQIKLFFDNTDDKKANSIIEYISYIRNTSFEIGNSSKMNSPLFSENVTYDPSNFVRANILINERSCSVYANYNEPRNQFVVELLCFNNKLKKEHYPVKDNF